MMPEIESRVDFQQVQLVVTRVSLEIDLYDARKPELLEQRSSQPTDLVIIGDLDIGRKTIETRRRPQLPPGELGHHLAARADVSVIAHDAILAALDGRLHDEIGFVRLDNPEQTFELPSALQPERLLSLSYFGEPIGACGW